jgi:membrane protein DedA with SNARE-associated domain
MVLGSTFLFHAVSHSDRFERAMPARVVSLVQRHHVYGVAVARLVPGLRNATVFAAAGQAAQRVFLAGLVPAALVWSGLLLALGWFGGAAMLDVFGQLHHSRLLQLVSLFIFTVVIFVILWSRVRDARDEQPGGEIP